MKKVKKEEPSPKKMRKCEEDEYSPAKVCVHTVDPLSLSHCMWGHLCLTATFSEIRPRLPILLKIVKVSTSIVKPSVINDPVPRYLMWPYKAGFKFVAKRFAAMYIAANTIQISGSVSLSPTVVYL